MDRELRLPLQVGTSSLIGFSQSALAFLPGCFLFFTIALPALFAPWDEAASIYPPLITPYIFAITLGVALVGWSVRHFKLAFKQRPSDVVITSAGFRIEGGSMGGFQTPWSEIESINMTGSHEKLGLFEDQKHQKNKDDNFWRLIVDLKDGSTRVLGSAEDLGERDSLRSLYETLCASRDAATIKRPAAPRRGPTVFQCTGCGAPTVPADMAVVACRYCGTGVAISDDVRGRIRALMDRDVAAKKSDQLVSKLVRQPGALRTGFLIAMSAIPSWLAWPAALAGMTVLYALCYLRFLNGLLLIVAAVCVIAGSYYLVRGQLTDRQALRMVALGFAARAPTEAGGTHHCRTCDAPLVEPPGSLLVHCVHCNAENVLGLDARGDAAKGDRQVASLEDSLFRRDLERSRWRFSGWAAVVIFVATAVIIDLSMHPPHPIVAIGHAQNLERITYDPYNEFQPRISPNGASLLYDLRVPGEEADEAIMLANANGAFRGTEMTYEKQHAIRPTWTNDGKGFVYVQTSNGTEILQSVMSLAPFAHATDLYSFKYDIDMPSMAPDNSHLVFAGAESKAKGWSMYVGTLDGAPSKLLGPGINPAWSPDGGRIAYSRTVVASRQILMAYLDAAKTSVVSTVQLTTDGCDHETPVFSPDGAYIAFVGNCGSKTRGSKDLWDLYAMKSDGTDIEQLTDGAADIAMPAWSGDYVYFSADVAENYDIWRVHLTGPLAGHSGKPVATPPPPPAMSTPPPPKARPLTKNR